MVIQTQSICHKKTPKCGEKPLESEKLPLFSPKNSDKSGRWTRKLNPKKILSLVISDSGSPESGFLPLSLPGNSDRSGHWTQKVWSSMTIFLDRCIRIGGEIKVDKETQEVNPKILESPLRNIDEKTEKLDQFSRQNTGKKFVQQRHLYVSKVKRNLIGPSNSVSEQDSPKKNYP